MAFPQMRGPSPEGVYTIILGNSENRIDFEYIQKMLEHLAKIGKAARITNSNNNFARAIANHSRVPVSFSSEATEGQTACVLAGEGKFFSNGLNIDVLMAQPKELLGSFHRREPRGTGPLSST